MLGTKEKPDAVEVNRLLAGAAKAIRSARYCWLATTAEDSFANLRPMLHYIVLHDDADSKDEWTIRFITDGRSRKAADIRRTGRVAIIFQHDPDDAFVTLIGKATLCEIESQVRKRWKKAYDVYFPSELDIVEVEVDIVRIELWIRGVTPEPFGLRATILERDARRDWRGVFR
jgi:general stress protein 26